jgi:glycosidase
MVINLQYSIVVMKKLCFMILIALGCSGEESQPKPVIPPSEREEPKQYGVPFQSVPDARDVILYEINIRAFSTDGNFQGVIDRLDQIKELGVNTIWLMPIHPVGQVRSAGGLGSPYAVQNYLEVNPEFGDLTKLRELVDEAHERGIAVMIDWVANHTSWDNPWMADKSWYTQDGSGNVIIPPGTNWQDVAELNYDNASMREEMIYAMKYWILEANIDGFRCDAVDFVPSDFWSQALTTLKAIPGRKLILLAEGGKQENFTAGFQMNYAWDFFSNLKEVYNNGKSAATIFTTHNNEYNSIPPGTVKLRYTTNHDLSAWEATPVQTFQGENGALSASMITIFMSAAPLIYSSQEVAREELLPFFTKDPIDWSQNGDVFDTYQKLLAIYSGSSAFREGTLKSFPNTDMAIFTKTLGEEVYLIIANVRNAESTWAIDETLKNQSWTNMFTDTAYPMATTLSLPPFGWIILKKN